MMCSRRLNDLARASRARSQAKIVAVTGSVGKTGTKEALRLVLGRQGETHASAASYNNHWGVPLSLALMPQVGEVRRVRDRHESRGRDHAADASSCARMWRSSPRSRRCIWNSSARSRRSRTRRRRSFSASNRAAPPCINADNAQFARLEARRAGRRRRSASLRSANAMAPTRSSSRSRCRPKPRPCRRAFSATTSPTSSARRAGTWSTIRSRVLAAAQLLGADLALAALALADLKPPVGRGERVTLEAARRRRAADRRELQRESDLDARGAGAARPGADARASAGASRCSATCSSSARTARRCMRTSRDAVTGNAVDLVFCAGPLMKSLWDALPSGAPGRLCRDLRGARAGSSGRDRRRRCRHGQRFARLAHGSDRQGAQAPLCARGRTGFKVEHMLYWLADFSGTISASSTCFAISPCAPAARW